MSAKLEVKCQIVLLYEHSLSYTASNRSFNLLLRFLFRLCFYPFSCPCLGNLGWKVSNRQFPLALMTESYQYQATLSGQMVCLHRVLGNRTGSCCRECPCRSHLQNFKVQNWLGVPSFSSILFIILYRDFLKQQFDLFYLKVILYHLVDQHRQLLRTQSSVDSWACHLCFRYGCVCEGGGLCGACPPEDVHLGD